MKGLFFVSGIAAGMARAWFMSTCWNMASSHFAWRTINLFEAWLISFLISMVTYNTNDIIQYGKASEEEIFSVNLYCIAMSVIGVGIFWLIGKIGGVL